MLISLIGSQVSTKDQLLLPRMRYGNAYNMSAIAIHKHKVSQLIQQSVLIYAKEFTMAHLPSTISQNARESVVIKTVTILNWSLY